jgi:hypothetical protein
MEIGMKKQKYLRLILFNMVAFTTISTLNSACSKKTYTSEERENLFKGIERLRIVVQERYSDLPMVPDIGGRETEIRQLDSREIVNPFDTQKIISNILKDLEPIRKP